MNPVQEIDLFFRKISPDKGFIYLIDKASQPLAGLVLHVPSQIEPLLSQYSIADLKLPEKRIEFGQQIYKLFDGTPLLNQLRQIVRDNQAHQIYTRFVWHCPQPEKIFSNLYLELLHNGKNFVFNDPLFLSGRQANWQTVSVEKERNAALRILLLNQAASEPREIYEVVRTLFPQLNQRLIEIEVFSGTIDEDAAHYIASYQPQIIWYCSHPDLEKYAEIHSFNLARLIKVIPAISSLRLLVVEGLEALTDETAFSLVRWEPEFTNLQIPARIFFPDRVNPELIGAFFQQLLLPQPIDLALKQAKAKQGFDIKSAAAPPIIYFKSLQGFGQIQSPAPILSPLRGNDTTAIWGYLFNPVLTSMRNYELSKICRTLFEKNKPAVAVYGTRGSGKSELVEQFMMQQHLRFQFVRRFGPDDYALPQLLLARIAAMLNLSDQCRAGLMRFPDEKDALSDLIAALNRTPGLLIFEDVPPDIFTSDSAPLSEMIRTLLPAILKNFKIIFTLNVSVEVGADFKSLIDSIPLGPYQFEQTWEFILRTETTEIPRFLLKNSSEGIPVPILSWQDLMTMHSHLAAQPVLIKILRYCAASLPAAGLQERLLNGNISEIQELLFQKFQQLMSNDVVDLLLTCSCLPGPFKLDQLLFIYKQRGANFEIIGDFLDELVYSGAIARHCLQLQDQKIIYGYKIDPFFSEYLQQQFPARIQEMQTAVFNKSGHYFENLADTESDLKNRLDAVGNFYRAGQQLKAEKLAQEIIFHLRENKLPALATKIIDQWQSLSFKLPVKLMQCYLEFHENVAPGLDESAGLSARPEIPPEKNAAPERDAFSNQGNGSDSNPPVLARNAPKLKIPPDGIANPVEFSAAKQKWLIEQGNRHFHSMQYQEARECYEKANFIENRAFVLLQLGNINFSEKEFQTAEEYYTEALVRARQENSPSLAAQILHQLGMLQTDLGNYPAAIGFLQESISLSETLQEPLNWADSLHELANVHYLTRDYTRALANYEKCFLISAEQGNVQDTVNTLFQIGLTYHALGDSVRAIEKLQESLEIAEDTAAIFDANYQLGMIYLALGNEKSALERFQICLAVARKNSDARSESDALYEIGYIYATQQNFPEAREKFSASLEISRRLGDQKRIEGTLFELQQLNEKRKLAVGESVFSSQLEELLE